MTCGPGLAASVGNKTNSIEKTNSRPGSFGIPVCCCFSGTIPVV
jgi:hypothetical protein